MAGSPLLAPAAALYGAGVATRLALYRCGLLRVEKASRPVVSVGNVAAGGTGKTPFVRWLAGELVRRGLVPSILTRGYRRRSRGPVVVSDGAGVLASPEASGDEAALLARELPGVPVVADARRARGARIAEGLGRRVDVHILDDGFSHVALARDVDIVLIDATAPDAGGALLPRGRLREPLESLARADLVVVTKSEQEDPSAALELARRYAPGTPLFRARTEVLGIRGPDGAAVDGAAVPEPLLAVCGIARPEAFQSTLAGLGLAPVRLLAYRDHAAYGHVELARLVRAAQETGSAAIVTTGKDAVKLEGRVDLPLFRVDVEARVVETGFVSEVVSRLGRLPS